MSTERVDEEMVRRALFDEAVRMGERSAALANHHIAISRVAVDAMNDALGMMKIGRITQARDRLDNSLLRITAMSASANRRVS